MIRKTSLAVSIIIFAQLLSGCGGSKSSSRHFATTYTAQELLKAPAYGHAASINDDGIISGTVSEFPSVAVTWSLDGSIHTLQSSIEYSNIDAGTGAGKMNSAGMVAGSARANEISKAIIWNSEGVPTIYPTPDGYTSCSASAVNTQGYVVGRADTGSTDDDRAIIWTPDKVITKLDLLPGSNQSWCSDINDQGKVVGYCQSHVTTTGECHATTWDLDGKVRELAALPNGNSTMAKAINNSGVIVGSCRIGTTNSYHAVVWNSHGTVRALSEPPGSSGSSANDVNDFGQIVGQIWSDAPNSIRAVLWNPDGSVVDLGSLLDAEESSAAGINNLGQIVGYVEYSVGHDTPILWLPSK